MKDPKHNIADLAARAHTMRDTLSKEDRIIWESVARTVRPLDPEKSLLSNHQHDLAEFTAALAKSGGVQKSAVLPKPVATEKKNKTGALHPIDHKTHRKISKGRLTIDARVDLHGLTQREAYTFLLHFVQSAQMRGYRHVLIITGKGASQGSDGVLRQIVPQWLGTGPFRLHVSGIEDAARHHGGQGALYVKLRRLSSTGGV